jgi:HEAT repeat protein
MKKLLLSSIAILGVLASFAAPVSAHGGQYRGPGDVVPPNPGGGGGGAPAPGGPTTGGPSGPSAPAPAGPSAPSGGPSTGGPAPGGPQGGGPTTGQGMPIGDDLTTWAFWWEFNKDPFINLREAVHKAGEETVSEEFFTGSGQTNRTKATLKPSKADILNKILPELKRALDNAREKRETDIISSCLIAMAKIGENHPDFDILPIFRDIMSGNFDQEIQETAAVAMGISQMPEAIQTLRELVTESAEGKKIVGSTAVNNRTRTFATYGIALVAYATEDNDVKRQAFEAIKSVVEDDTIVDRNVRVAALNALGLLKPNPNDDNGKKLLEECLKVLDTYYAKKLGAGERLIQAHVPPAVAKLLQNVDATDEAFGADLHENYKKKYVQDLKTRDDSNEIEESLVLALGQLGRPVEKSDRSSTDAQIRDALRNHFERGRDQQAKLFSLLALGQVGGTDNRDYLLDKVRKSGKVIERPWAALGLGVMSHFEWEAGNVPSSIVGDALLEQAKDAKDPTAQSAMCVALGLARHTEAADYLRELLTREWNKNPLGGYICIGLALMGDPNSVKPIQETVKKAVRRPELLQQAAIALGKLGDKEVSELLIGLLNDGDTNLAKMSAIASALGFIGDQRTIDPLIKLINDESLTPLSRAFAVVALGGVADKELLPWNSKIGVNMNYRAAVETLTNQQNGILDIL